MTLAIVDARGPKYVVIGAGAETAWAAAGQSQAAVANAAIQVGLATVEADRAEAAATSVEDLRDEFVLHKQAVLDWQNGRAWSLAAWYLANPARRLDTPWYHASDSLTLFQDEAGTTPVEDDGDPVRLILAKNGNTAHDLLIFNTAIPATYRIRNGIGMVDLGGVAAFKQRGNFTLKAPLFQATSTAWRDRAKSILGVSLDGLAYAVLNCAGNVQDRAQLLLNGTNIAEQGYNPASSAFGICSGNAPQVIHSQLQPGSTDILVNGIGADEPISVNTWTGAGVSTSAKILVGMLIPDAANGTDADFYGGFIYPGIIDAGLRALVVEYMRIEAERPAHSDDLNIAVYGDSTGDNDQEYTGAGGAAPTGGDWPYRLMGHLAADNSGMFVSHREWEHIYGWGSAEHIQQGEGPGLVMWNASIAGAQPGQHLGVNFPSISSIPDCQAVIINHGYNIGASSTSPESYAAAYEGLIEEVKRRHPNAHLFLTKQPDTQAGATYTAALHSAVDALAALYDATIIDIADEFASHAGPEAKWSDGLHFTEFGANLAGGRAHSDWNAALPLTRQKPGFLARTPATVFATDCFDNWTAGMPTGWTKTGAGTVVEVPVDDSDSGPVAAEIVDSASTSTYISKAFAATAVQGQPVMTLLARIKMDADAAFSDLSQIRIATNGTGGKTTLIPTSSRWAGDYLWCAGAFAVPADCTTITVSLYGRESGARAIATAYSRLIIVVGNEPRVGGSL